MSSSAQLIDTQLIDMFVLIHELLKLFDEALFLHTTSIIKMNYEYIDQANIFQKLS